LYTLPRHSSSLPPSRKMTTMRVWTKTPTPRWCRVRQTHRRWTRSLGIRVLGFREQGAGFRDQGLGVGFEVWGLGIRA